MTDIDQRTPCNFTESQALAEIGIAVPELIVFDPPEAGANSRSGLEWLKNHSMPWEIYPNQAKIFSRRRPVVPVESTFYSSIVSHVSN